MCTIRDLYAFAAPTTWTAAPLLRISCEAFLASFKVWNTATVGGNVCMSLPAGPMITMTVALEATYRCGRPAAPNAPSAAADFVTGDHQNILRPGELLRSIHIPASALRKRQTHRRFTLTKMGRSTIFMVATQSPGSDDLSLVITAGTTRPVRLSFDAMPSADTLAQAVDGDRRGRVVRRPERKSRSPPPPREALRPTRSGPNSARAARHDVHGERQDVRRRARARPVPAHLRPGAGLSRRQEGLRRRRLRCVHGVAGRRPGAQLHHARIPRRRPRGHHHRGTWHARRPASDAGTVPLRPRLPVRLLHRGDDHDRGHVHRRRRSRTSLAP